MERSESTKELATALAKAQGEMAGAKKDSANPFFKSKYADLASVWEACRVPLSSNGLAVSQWIEESDPEHVRVTTRLDHSSGEWLASTMNVLMTKPDAQGMGSAITYARRYALAAAVGVAPEDDDAESAVGRPQTTYPQYQKPVQSLKPDEPLKKASANKTAAATREHLGIQPGAPPKVGTSPPHPPGHLMKAHEKGYSCECGQEFGDRKLAGEHHTKAFAQGDAQSLPF